MTANRQATTHLITEQTQRDALASPLRMEIISYFEGGRGLTVRDVAAHLRRPVASLYFHVHKLVDCGLLLKVGERGKGRGAEAVYRAVADRIALQVNPRAPASVEATVKTVRSLLRQAAREFESAVRSTGLLSRMGANDVAGRRQRVWLSKRDAAEIRKRLDELERFLQEKSRPSGGVEHTWTSLFVPLVAGRRTKSLSKPGSNK